MYHAKNMTRNDFDFAAQITDTMNWKLSREDFEFMLNLEPEGCFVLYDNTQRIGVVTTISYGQTGWFGNLIVAETHRNKGAGTFLAKQAVEYLTGKQVKTIGIYAYINKVPFYRKLGFEPNIEFTVLEGTGRRSPYSSSTAANLRPAKKNDVEKIVNLDQACFGASRRRLLEPLLLNPGNRCHVYIEDEKVIGCATAKAYGDMAELGPLSCQPHRSDVAVDLLKASLSQLNEVDVSIYLPKKELEVQNTLRSLGFKENFRVVRMFLGPELVNECIYAAESLERG